MPLYDSQIKKGPLSGRRVRPVLPASSPRPHLSSSGTKTLERTLLPVGNWVYPFKPGDIVWVKTGKRSHSSTCGLALILSFLPLRPVVRFQVSCLRPIIPESRGSPHQRKLRPGQLWLIQRPFKVMFQKRKDNGSALVSSGADQSTHGRSLSCQQCHKTYLLCLLSAPHVVTFCYPLFFTNIVIFTLLFHHRSGLSCTSQLELWRKDFIAITSLLLERCFANISYLCYGRFH